MCNFWNNKTFLSGKRNFIGWVGGWVGGVAWLRYEALGPGSLHSLYVGSMQP